MSARNVTAQDLPFSIENLRTTDADDQERNRNAAETFRAATTAGVFMSLGASVLRSVPGTHELGGLLFIARILPLTGNRRAEQPRRMVVMVSVNGADLIDIDVRHLTGHEHATARDLYVDQLQRALLALDYDGPTAFNPRYWTN